MRWFNTNVFLELILEQQRVGYGVFVIQHLASSRTNVARIAGIGASVYKTVSLRPV